MRYLHIRKRTNGAIKAKGGVTVAYEVNGNIVMYATAKCSKKDSYCKRTGRDIATGRFLRSFRGGTVDKHAKVVIVGASGKPIETIIHSLKGAA